MITADIIVDLQYGDCAKGKVSHHLAKERTYTHVLRYNGGCNAGHTIFHEGKKFVTHHIPAGVFFGIKSVIGPGCVLDPAQFKTELAEIEAGGVDTNGKIFVAKNTHVITEEHRMRDGAVGDFGRPKIKWCHVGDRRKVCFDRQLGWLGIFILLYWGYRKGAVGKSCWKWAFVSLEYWRRSIRWGQWGRGYFG